MQKFNQKLNTQSLFICEFIGSACAKHDANRISEVKTLNLARFRTAYCIFLCISLLRHRKEREI